MRYFLHLIIGSFMCASLSNTIHPMQRIKNAVSCARAATTYVCSCAAAVRKNQKSYAYGAACDTCNYLIDFRYMLGDMLWEMFARQRVVGALSPSTPRLARRITKPAANNNRGPLTMLDLGCGVGSTLRILITERMQKGDHVDAVEIKQRWCDLVDNRYPHAKHENFQCHCAAFEKWKCPLNEDRQGAESYDIIFCTLPWTQLPDEIATPCKTKILQLLKPKGIFVFIRLKGKYGPINLCTAATDAKNALFDAWCAEHFENITCSTEWMNLLPAYVYVMEKKS